MALIGCIHAAHLKKSGFYETGFLNSHVCMSSSCWNIYI